MTQYVLIVEQIQSIPSALRLGLGRLGFSLSQCQLDGKWEWANGNSYPRNLMVEIPNKSQPNPGLRVDWTPCTTFGQVMSILLAYQEYLLLGVDGYGDVRLRHLDLLPLELLPAHGSGGGGRDDVLPVPVERDVLADVAVEVVLDLAAAELLLEGGLRGGVEHLAADARGVGRPADEDPPERGALLLVQPEREEGKESWLVGSSQIRMQIMSASLNLSVCAAE